MGLLIRTLSSQTLCLDDIRGAVLSLLAMFGILFCLVSSSLIFEEGMFPKMEEANPTLIKPVKEMVTVNKPVIMKKRLKVPIVAKTVKYSFEDVPHSFGKKVDLTKLSSARDMEIKTKILNSIPPYMRDDASKYVGEVLRLAHKYKVDPFWVLAIMWTESHFKKRARSPAGAKGLMQIMPDTKRYLERIAHTQGIRLSNNQNVELGVLYLKRLLNHFNNNFIHATVAYNMGPNRIERWLKDKRPVGVRNQYLDKVRDAYGQLTKNFYNS